MLQHGFVQCQLDIEDLFESDLAAVDEAMGTLEGEARGPADVVKGAYEVEGLRILAALGTGFEGTVVRQALFVQKSVVGL
jgi:hypothetical protein